MASNEQSSDMDPDRPTSTRFQFSPSQVEILNKYWERGMKSCGTEEMKEMLKSAQTEIGVDLTKIKTWVWNKSSKGSSTRTRKRLPINPRKQSETDDMKRVCMSEFMLGKAGNDVLTNAHKKWAEAKEDESEQARLKELAKDRQHLLHPTIDDLSDRQKNERAKTLLKLIEDRCNQMKEEMGYEVSVQAASPEYGTSYSGTVLGMEWAKKDNCKAVNDFWRYTTFDRSQRNEGSSHSQEEGSTVEEEKSKLRKEVTQKINEIYKRDTGVSTGVQFTAFERGDLHIKAHGWPEGVPFKHPNTRGKIGLEKIMDRIKEIRFEISIPGGSTSDRNSAEEAVMEEEYHPTKELAELQQMVSSNNPNVSTATSTLSTSKGKHSTKGPRKGKGKCSQKKKGKTDLHKEQKRDDGDEYMVEEVLDTSVRDGILNYRVKWVDDSTLTWEPAANLVGNIIFERYLVHQQNKQ